MSNVVSMVEYRLRKQLQPGQKVSRLVLAQLQRKEQLNRGLKRLNKLPRATFPDHEPPGAA